MKRSVAVGVIVVFLLAMLLSVSAADLPTSTPCKTDASCTALNKGTTTYYCNVKVGKCYAKAVVKNTTVVKKNTTTAVTSDVDTLKKDIKKLQGDLSSLQQDIAKATSDVSFLKNNIQGVESSVSKVQQQISTLSSDTGTKLTSINTGLAGLQKSIDSTKKEILDVDKKTGRNLTLFIVILVLVGGALTFYFVKRKNAFHRAHPETHGYITKSLKQGKKFDDIKGSLQQAGWKDRDIHWAYKQTMKHNYNQYQKGKKKVVGSHKENKQKKAIAIAVGTVVLLGIIVLFIQGNTGQAINLGQVVKEDTNELVYEVKCTGNHTLSDQGTCCLDLNRNSVCDSEEEFAAAQALVEEDAAICTDHLDCTTGKRCIDNKCQVLKELYTTADGCICNFNFVSIKTSDGETHYTGPNQGSYTGAGALAWTVLPAPVSYCPGKALIPIEIEELKDGTLQRKRIITLKKYEKSKEIKHQQLPVSLTLEVDNIFQNSC